MFCEVNITLLQGSHLSSTSSFLVPDLLLLAPEWAILDNHRRYDTYLHYRDKGYITNKVNFIQTELAVFISFQSKVNPPG